jgi:hypothetical protein
LRLSEKSAPPLRVKQTHHIIFEIFLAKAQSEGFGRMCLVYIKNQFKHAKVVLQFTVHLGKSNRNFLLYGRMQLVPTTNNYSLINSNGFPAFARLKTIHIAHHIIISLWALARNHIWFPSLCALENNPYRTNHKQFPLRLSEKHPHLVYQLRALKNKPHLTNHNHKHSAPPRETPN